MNTKISAPSFPRNHTTGQIGRTNGMIGPRQPPRNSVTAIADVVITCRYSARKNIANLMPEYSV